MPQALTQAGFVALWHPGLIAVSLALIWAYGMAVGPWRHRFPDAAPVPRRQVLSFVLAILSFYVAVGSPLDIVSDHYLMSAHMLEHVLLTFALAPLLLLGLPTYLARWLVRPRPVRVVLARMTRPLTALVLFNVIFSLFHMPKIYDYTLTHPLAHFGEHALFVVTALFMWWPILSPLPEMPRLPDPQQLLYLFANEVFQTVAFALITFAPHPMYSVYVHAPRIFGITALQDQQLGGMLMKMGAILALGPAFWVTFFRWARREQWAARPDRYVPTDAPRHLASDPGATDLKGA